MMHHNYFGNSLKTTLVVICLFKINESTARGCYLKQVLTSFGCSLIRYICCFLHFPVFPTCLWCQLWFTRKTNRKANFSAVNEKALNRLFQQVYLHNCIFFNYWCKYGIRVLHYNYKYINMLALLFKHFSVIMWRSSGIVCVHIQHLSC